MQWIVSTDGHALCGDSIIWKLYYILQSLSIYFLE